MNSLKQLTFNNIAFNATAKIISVVCLGISSIILTRTLQPNDYGIVGFAMIFVNFLSQFNDLGFSSAVVQRKELDDRALYTGFTFRLGLAVFLYALAAIGSGASGWFIDNKAVADVIKVSALSFLVISFSFVPTALLKRDLNYKKISIANMSYSMTNSLLAIILALSGFKYWSIVLANLCASIVMVVMLNLMRPRKVRIVMDTSIASELFKFGGSVTLVGLLVFAIFNADNFIIGSVAGETELGYYVVAFNWGAMICTALGSVVNSVLFSTFSRMDNDSKRIVAAYLRVLEYASFIGILLNATLFLVAKDFLVYVLGAGTDKWMSAFAALRILSIYGILRFFLEPIGSVFMAIGRPDILLKSNGVAAVIEISLLYPALEYFGLEGVAIVITMAYASNYLICFSNLKRNVSFFYREIISRLTASAMAGVLVVLVLENLKIQNEGIERMVLKSVLCISGYFVVHGILTKWKLLKEIKLLIANVSLK